MQHDPCLLFFSNYIQSELGVVYGEHNYFQLQNRLEEICKLLGVNSLQELHVRAQQGIKGSFKQLLLDLATNNETSFFRDYKLFRAVETIVLGPEARDPFKTDCLRLWSAASSTGQEALSLAMMINEHNQKNKSLRNYKILATDISERVLQQARSHSYSQLEVQRGLPAALLVKYFSKDAQDRWIASSQLTQNIEFKKLNLREKFPFVDTFQVIFIRNVLIYQNVESKKEILERVMRHLTPGGILALGSGESMLGLSDAFEQVSIDGAIVYRKKELRQAA